MLIEKDAKMLMKEETFLSFFKALVNTRSLAQDNVIHRPPSPQNAHTHKMYDMSLASYTQF